MLKDITLGQYYPGNSVLHNADPRVKIILALLYMIAVFLAKNVFAFSAIIVFTVIITVVSTIPVSTVLKAIKPLIFIMAFTAIINIFWTDGDKLLLKFWIIEVYLEGVMYALFMVIRIVSLLAGTSVILTYTTTPIALTDGIERLLSPLKKIKLPVHEFAMMMTIALRFVPTLIEETEKIMSAQKARGADFSTGKLKDRAKALVPILIPLFISAFRRADELATAMECRCYRGGDGRTRMTVLKLNSRDIFLIVIFLIFIASVILFNGISGIAI